ncbi:MAG: hydrogenase maturation protease [Terriglobales bacterium]
MARVLVLGYGNPLRTDDGLGWHVAVELFRTNSSREVKVVPCHQLTPELAEAVGCVETVIFIDCTRKGKPGEACEEEVQPQSGSTSFTHDLSPAALLALAAELFGACPKAYLFSICGECFAPGEDLSATVSGRVPVLKSLVRRRIEEALWPSASPAPGAPRTLVS